MCIFRLIFQKPQAASSNTRHVPIVRWMGISVNMYLLKRCFAWIKQTIRCNNVMQSKNTSIELFNFQTPLLYFIL